MDSYFFEITPDDVIIACRNHLGIELTETQAEALADFDEDTEARLLDGLDNLDNLDEQTEAIQEALAEWLKEEGRLDAFRKNN